MAVNKCVNMDDFLSTYKELESFVSQNHGQSVFEYESGLDSEIGKKLQLCRNMRNYVQHNKDGYQFVVVSEDMLAFLKGLCLQERSLLTTTKDMIVKPFVKRKLSDTVLSGAKLLVSKKLECIPVLDDDKHLVGVLNRDNMIRLSYTYELNDSLLFQDVLRVVKPTHEKLWFLKPDVLASDAMAYCERFSFDMILVSDTGTQDGKVLGRIFVE